MEIETEKWLPVVGYEGLYEVSEWGRVRSLAREISYKVKGKRRVRKVSDKILATRLHSEGSWFVTLYKNKSAKVFLIHRLVAHHFLITNGISYIVRHKSLDRSDNSVSNLHIQPLTEFKHDQLATSDYFGTAKLRKQDVLKIRQLLLNKVKQPIIAKMYGVSTGTIQTISAKRTWKHVL